MLFGPVAVDASAGHAVERAFGAADLDRIASDYVNKSQEAISPTNPYGFHDGARRIDTAEGGIHSSLAVPDLLVCV